MSLETFSSRNVNVAWGGMNIVGLAQDGFVTITPSSDITDEEVGSDGQLQTSILPDRTGTVTIQLQQNSPSNNDLAGLLDDQMYGSRFFRKAEMTVCDPSGSVIVRMINAYLKSRPEITLGSTATGNTYSWTFFCEELRYLAQPNFISAELSVDIGSRVDSAKGIVGR